MEERPSAGKVLLSLLGGQLFGAGVGSVIGVVGSFVNLTSLRVVSKTNLDDIADEIIKENKEQEGNKPPLYKIFNIAGEISSTTFYHLSQVAMSGLTVRNLFSEDPSRLSWVWLATNLASVAYESGRALYRTGYNKALREGPKTSQTLDKLAEQ